MSYEKLKGKNLPTIWKTSKPIRRYVKLEESTKSENNSPMQVTSIFFFHAKLQKKVNINHFMFINE